MSLDEYGRLGALCEWNTEREGTCLRCNRSSVGRAMHKLEVDYQLSIGSLYCDSCFKVCEVHLKIREDIDSHKQRVKSTNAVHKTFVRSMLHYVMLDNAVRRYTPPELGS